jgi:xanthine/uracil permease
MTPQRRANDVGQTPGVLARLGLFVPIFVWFGQAAIYFAEPHWAATSYIAIAVAQGALLVAGAICGILALALGIRGGARVIVPAVIGLVISVGTVLLVSFLILSRLLAQAAK